MLKVTILFFAFFQARMFCSSENYDQSVVSSFTGSTIRSSEEDIGKSNGESFGSATLKRISNLTSFPMFIKLVGQENKLGLSDNSIIRITTKSKKFGDKKPYIAFSEEKDKDTGVVRSLLRANIYDGENLSCYFKIKNFLDNSGQPYILLSPSKSENKFLMCDNKSSDKFLPIFDEDIPSKNNKKSLWIFEGENDEFFLKNAETNGYLAPALIVNSEKKDEDKIFKFKDKESLSEYFNKSEKEKCCFGDSVVIQDSNSFLYFSGSKDGFKLNSNDSSFFILKGEHSDFDRYNAPFGLPVKNGAIIRLEDPVTGKNITVSSLKSGGFEKDNYDHFDLTLNGSNGIGSSSDNWIINFSDTSTRLNIGTTFILQHIDTKTYLVIDGSQIGTIKLKDSYLDEQQKKIMDNVSKKNNSSESKKNKKIEATDLKDQYSNHKNWFISKKKVSKIDQQSLMRTGFENGAAYSRVSQDDPSDKNQQLSLEIISTENNSFIQPKSDAWKTVPLKNTSIKFSGLLEEGVPDLLPGSSLTIKPLLGEGVVWIEKSLITKNRFSLTFLAQVNDGSELAVVLGNELSEKYKYKIVLGGDKNTSTKLIKRKNEAPPFVDKILAKIYGNDYSLARLRTGVTIPIWVSFFEGLFLVGQSQNIGENIILAFEEKGFLENINRLGFSCNTNPIIISNVSFGVPLQPSSPIRIYEKELAFSPDVLSKKGFRQKDQFFAVFHSDKITNSEIVFGSDEHKKKYLLNLSFSSGLISISQKEGNNESVIFKIENESLPDIFGTDSSFWVNYNNGLFFVGVGEEPCSSPIFIFQAKDPLNKMNQFSCSSKSNINRISINSGGFFTQKLENNLSTEQEEVVDKNKMVGIMPYEYQLEQVDDWVTIKDFITSKTYFISRTAQKDADYSLLLSINTKGLPKMRWAWQPENENLMKEKFQARMMAGVSDGLSQAAMAISGVGDIGESIAAAANIVTTSATLAPAILAAKLSASATYDYLAAGDKVAIKNEKSIKIDSSMKVNESRTAIINRFAVEKSLASIKDTSASTRENFFMILSSSKKIVNLTTSSHVLGTLQLKNSFFKVVDELYQYYDELFESNKNAQEQTDIDNSTQEFINLLVEANNNPFIFSNQVQEEVSRRAKWMSWANMLFRKTLKKNPLGSIDIPPLFGNHFWLEKKLKTKGVGKVVFQVKGSGNIFVTFSDKPTAGAIINKEFYSLEFINSETKTCSLKLSTFGASVFSSNNNLLSISEIDFKKIFVSINKGIISVGIINENLEEEVLETFIDPYPLLNESFIGFGTFNSWATISNIEIA